MKNFFSSYKDLNEVFRGYWKIYGGWKDFIKSPYLHVAFLFTFIFFPYGKKGSEWWDLPIDVLPNLVGFSLGGYAIFLALGDDGFKKIIAGKDRLENTEDASPYLHANTTFFHFIVTQISSLLISIFTKIMTDAVRDEAGNIPMFLDVISFLNFSLFLYAITLTIGATVELYRLAGWYDKHAEYLKGQDE
jgi:hypothetical protein